MAKLSSIELNPTQVGILQAILGMKEQILCEFRFNEPAKDAERLRQHAAVSGARDMLIDLLMYDQRLNEQQEQEKQEQLARQLAATNVGLDPFTSGE